MVASPKILRTEFIVLLFSRHPLTPPVRKQKTLSEDRLHPGHLIFSKDIMVKSVSAEGVTVAYQATLANGTVIQNEGYIPALHLADTIAEATFKFKQLQQGKTFSECLHERSEIPSHSH